jgi:diaminopimelate epimerase
MPGGTLQVTVSEGLDVVLRGPVEAVMDGALVREWSG